ncbi:MAG: hypothetical protein R3312_09870 [Gammaproteobacteria bacterium]|nr:hypothetical protein [Gammaproteobacteria bacterium]
MSKDFVLRLVVSRMTDYAVEGMEVLLPAEHVFMAMQALILTAACSSCYQQQ